MVAKWSRRAEGRIRKSSDDRFNVIWDDYRRISKYWW
jgi:hypothetical protein